MAEAQVKYSSKHPCSELFDPGSDLFNQGSELFDPGSDLFNQGSDLMDPGSDI